MNYSDHFTPQLAPQFGGVGAGTSTEAASAPSGRPSGGGFPLGGRLQQQAPRETALAAAMRSVNAAQRPTSATAAGSASASSSGVLPSGLNFTNELSARRAVLEVLAKHNASTAAAQNTLTGQTNKIRGQNQGTIDLNHELVKPKMQFGATSGMAQPVFPSMNGGVGMAPMPSAMMTMAMANQQSVDPPISKKALLMKRACLEAESRPQLPFKKKARKSIEVASEQVFFAANEVAAEALDNNSEECGSNPQKLVPASDEPISNYADDDVLCGRGGGTNVHPGNRRFRDLIHGNRRRYLRAKKNDKPAISRSIVQSVRRAGGRFLRKDEASGMWFEIGDAGAREKTSQALRQRAPEMRKILFEDETHRDGMARNAVVEHHQAQHMAMAAAARQQTQQQHQVNFAATSMNKVDLFQPHQFQQLGDQASVEPIPANAADLHRLSQDQNTSLSNVLASLGPSQDFQKLPSPSPAIQATQQQAMHQKTMAPLPLEQNLKQSAQNQQSKDMLLQSRLGMNPQAAYVQRNAQSWTTQTLLGRGINTFTPNIA